MPDVPVNKTEKGQSFVELMLVVIFLMLFILGIVEFGTLLNQYLNIVDAARESARISSDLDPDDYASTDLFIADITDNAQKIMLPIVLDSSRGDDIVVSYFSVGDNKATDLVRYPAADPNGKNLYGNHVTQFTDDDIRAELDDSAPVRGILVVEIYYNHPQMLKAPIFTAIIPDPIPVYAYAMFPLPRVEP